MSLGTSFVLKWRPFMLKFQRATQPPVSSELAEGFGWTGDNFSSFLRTLSMCPALELSWTSLCPCCQTAVQQGTSKPPCTLLGSCCWSFHLSPSYSFSPQHDTLLHVCTSTCWLSCSSWCLERLQPRSLRNAVLGSEAPWLKSRGWKSLLGRS